MSVEIVYVDDDGKEYPSPQLLIEDFAKHETINQSKSIENLNSQHRIHSINFILNFLYKKLGKDVVKYCILPFLKCNHRTLYFNCAFIQKYGLCCACLDKRPLQNKYEKYVDQKGICKVANRQDDYCSECKDFYNYKTKYLSRSERKRKRKHNRRI